MVDVTSIPSSSTSMSPLPKTPTTAWVIKPKVVTQEPTVGKINHLREKPQQVEAKIEPQEPTSAKEVEPQEPILPHDDARIDVEISSSESHRIQEDAK